MKTDPHLGSLGWFRQLQRHSLGVTGAGAEALPAPSLRRQTLELLANTLELFRATARRRRRGRARAVLRHEAFQLGSLCGFLRRRRLGDFTTLDSLVEKFGVVAVVPVKQSQSAVHSSHVFN